MRFFEKKTNLIFFLRKLQNLSSLSLSPLKSSLSPVGVGVVLEALEDPADLVPHVVQGGVGEAGGDDDGVVVEPLIFFFENLK